MSLYDIAQDDINTITGDASEWGKSMILIDPDGEQASILGIHVKHHTDFDEQGFPVNGKVASIAISEDNVLAANAAYPIRNTAGEVDMKAHRVQVADSTGDTKQYRIVQWFPDETVGLIVCILSDYQ